MGHEGTKGCEDTKGYKGTKGCKGIKGHESSKGYEGSKGHDGTNHNSGTHNSGTHNSGTHNSLSGNLSLCWILKYMDEVQSKFAPKQNSLFLVDFLKKNFPLNEIVIFQLVFLENLMPSAKLRIYDGCEKKLDICSKITNILWM